MADSTPRTPPPLPVDSSLAPARALLIALTGSNVFALIVGSIYEYLSLRGVLSRWAAWCVLVFVWLLGVVGIVISEWVWGKGLKQRIWTGIIAAVLLGAILLGFDAFTSYFITKQEPVPPPLIPAAPVPPTTVINQNAADSTCANQVAQAGSQINCDAEKGKHDKAKTKH